MEKLNWCQFAACLAQQAIHNRIKTTTQKKKTIYQNPYRIQNNDKKKIDKKKTN